MPQIQTELAPQIGFQANAVHEHISEKDSNRWRRIGAAVIATAAQPFMMNPLSAEQVEDQMTVLKTSAQLSKEGVADTLESWRAFNTKEKVAKPLLGTFAWAKLIFGESIAVGLQGLAQSQNVSDLHSFTVGVGSALAVEAGFTLPIAAKHKEKQSPETVAEAAATAFWLGGAMGVENKKLPLKQAPAAIGAYMIFGTALAGAAEYNNLAEQAVSHGKVVIPSLVAWGALKKVNEHFGYKGFFDRMADKSVKGVRRVRDSFRKPK